MSENNIVYSTGLAGGQNLFELQRKNELHEQRKRYMDFEFSEPVSLCDEYELDDEYSVEMEQQEEDAKLSQWVDLNKEDYT